MTDKPNKPNKSTKAMKATQLEILNAIIDKQTEQLNELTDLIGTFKAILDTLTSTDKDKKCSCKDGGCSCKDTGCYCDVPDASDTAPEVKYPRYLSDLVNQWKGIQPSKSEKDCFDRITELEEKLKKEEVMSEQHIAELNKMHHLDIVNMRKKYEELLNEAKRGCKCNDTEWDVLIDDDETEEYDDEVFMRFALASNKDVTIGLRAAKACDSYTISYVLDYDDNSCSTQIVTNDIDKDLLESLCMKLTDALKKFDVEPTFNDLAKITTKLHKLLAELS